jgi:hypothetical protein
VIFHIIFAASILGALLHLWSTRSAGFSSRRIVAVSLLYLICIQWGFGAAFMSLGHIVAPDQVAGFIGWEPGSPFQVELGFASLGTSLLGILSIWFRGSFWLAPIVARSVFLLGAAYVHIEDILVHDNLSAGNAGPVLFYDIAVPILAIGLLVTYWRQGGFEPRR